MHKKIIALVVGIGLLLAIAISLLTQQRDAYAWSTNEDRLDQDFWDSDWTPGDNAQIINAVYGDGLGQLDKTRYTKYWTQHICDPNTINVVYINSGTNDVPDTLLGNTIYVLESGPHIKTGTVTMSDDCTAIVGQKTTSYSTGATLQFSGNFATGLYIDDATNIVVGQILFQPPTLGGNTIGTAIHTKNIDSSTIYVGEVRYYYNQGVLIEGGSNIYYNISANYGNPYGTVVTGVNDIMIGESTGQRFFFIRDNQTGLLIDNSQNVQLYGDIAYNTQAGAHIQNSSGVVFRGRYYTNNIGAGVIIENSTGIIFNKWQSNNPAFSANGGYGLYMKNVSGVTGNGLFAIGNTTFEGYGLYMENVTNLYLSNVVVRENIKNGIHITGSQNISLINTNSTGNSENGIQIVSSTNIAMSGGLMSGNQNHGVFLDQSSSGNIITGITSRENTFAGVYIANGANYNILQSSNIAGNGQNGVFINDVSYNTITGVVVTGTIGSAGITIMGSNANNNLVYNSSLYQNLGPGLVIAQGYANQVTNSVAYENNNFGMVIAADAYNNTISYSTSYNNIGYGGFAIDGSLGTPVNNTLDNIYAYGNDTDGLFLSFVTGVNYINNVYTYNNANNGVYIQDSANISGYNIHAYSNGVDGVNLLSANNNSLSFVQTYANTGNGIVVRGSSDNILQNIKTFANMDRGMTIEAKSPRNTVYNIQSYYNPVGIQITDYQTTQTTISNGLVYNNAIGLGSYNFTTFNNIAVFNNDTGAMLYGPRNILNNLNIFNNNAGIYIYSPIASDNKFNNISVYNNTKGIEIESSGNTYNGLHMFANTTKFIGTSGTDTQLDASSYPWASLFNNNLNDTGAMTCNWAIQATNASGQNVLPYPYCNARGPQAWTGSVNVRYTFFPDIIKQQQPVAYTGVLPSMTLIASGGYDANMYAGDFTWAGASPFGGHIELDESMSYTYQSGGFTYRNTVGPLAIDMISSYSPTAYIVTGVNDSTWNGILMQIGRNPWVVSHTPFYFDLAPGGLSIIRVAYQSAGQESNYYGMIRGVEDDDISINKQANVSSATPGQQIGFAITVTNSETAPAGSGQLVDFLPVGISPIGITASPAGVYSGSIHAYIWDIPVLSGGASYTFYITGTIISGYTGSVLINTGYYISDYTSNGAGWSIYDEAVVIFVVPGACGGSAQTGYGNVVLLTGGSAGLCEQGVVTLFTGPNQFNQYSWSCDGYNGGSNALCVAEYGWCGDGGLQSMYEQCDDGNNANGDGCSDRCNWETPTCTITANPVYALGSPTTFTFTFPAWAQAYNLNLGNAISISGTGTLSGMSYVYTYPALGTYTGTLSVRNAANTGRINTCTVQLSIVNAPVDGVCNSSTISQTYYTGTMPTGSLCTSGDPTVAVLSGGVRIWSCNGQHGGSSNSCQANISYCGDSIIGTGVGYSGQEQCDLGINNGDGISGCSDQCTIEVYGCTDPTANNYNQLANIDDGSCDYTPAMCEVLMYPGFTILEYETIPYDISGLTGNIISTMTLQSTTSSTYPIDQYIWSISSDPMGQGSVYTFDDSIIVSGQGTDTVVLDFSAYNSGDIARPFVFITLDIIDIFGNQATYQSYLGWSHDADGAYRLLGDEIIGAGSIGFDLSITGDLWSVMAGGLAGIGNIANIYQYYVYNSFTGLISIDWENDNLVDDAFIYSGLPYTYMHTYNTGYHTLYLGTNFGDMSQNVPVSYRTYPLVCGDIVCGNDILEDREDCDDGINNGLLCVPGYGQSCSYCSNTCQEIVVEGPYCGDGIVQNISGTTTSGSIDYVVSSNISLISGFEISDYTQYPQLSGTIYSNYSGHIQIYQAALSTGIAVNYQWTFSGYSSGGVNTGFIIGSYTGSSVTLFEDAVGTDSDLDGILTVQITDTEGNIVSTQSYLVLDQNSSAIISIGVSTINIASPQVTYSDYEVYIQSVQNNWTTINTSSGDRSILFGSSGYAAYDWLNDGIYDYIEQGDPQVVSYTYNITGQSITTDVSFFFSGLNTNISPILQIPGSISQSYTFHTTVGQQIPGSQERCDDGNNDDYDGCNAVCQWEQPMCTIQATPSSGVVPLSAGFVINQNTGSVLQYIDYGDGQTGMFMNYQYTNAGVYTATAYVANPQNTGIVFSCNTEITALNVPIDGVCNPNITDRLYYTGSMTLLADATQGLLCHTGTPTTPVLGLTGWTWTCNGAHGGSSDLCEADISYCGDAILGTGVGYNGQEQCDDGVNNGVACIPGYGQSCSYCSNTCQNIILTGSFCGDSVIDANQGEECDLGSANGQLASGCSVSCQLDQLVCNIMATNATGYPPLTTIFTAGPRSAGAYFDYGDGITGTNTVHIYTTPGSFIVTGYIPHPASGSIMLTCNYPVLVQDPVVSACDLPFVYSYTGGGSAYSGSQIPFALQITNTGSQYTGDYSIVTYIYSGGQVISLGATGWSDVNRTYGSGIYTGIVLQQTGLGSGAVAYHAGYANTIHTGSYIAVTQVRQSKNNQEYLCSMHTYTGSVGIAPYCGDGIVNQSSEECDGGTNCTTQCTIRRSSGGGGGISTDYCPNGDFSGSYYDGKCGEPVMHGAAPIGRACRYEDEQYLIRGTFTDSIRHRGRPYTEIMRLSCMWRGRQTKIGRWNVEPDGWMQRDEALKTFVKILGVAFENFDIQSEELLYTKTIPFADVAYDNWFSHYTNYAFTAGLTQGLTRAKDGKIYLDPTKNINRYEFAKLVVLAYEKIHGAIVVSSASTLQDVPMTHPYADYVRKLEMIGLVEGYKQSDGSRVFRGDQLISRAEVAKLVSMGFNEQLIVTEQAVIASSAYQMIARAIQQTKTDRLTFIRNLFEQLKKIDDKVFLDRFQVSKDIFLKTLADKVLMPMIQ